MKTQINGKLYLQKIQNVAYLCLGLPLLFFIYLYLESSADRLEGLIPEEYHTTVFLPSLLLCLGLIFWSVKQFRFLTGEAKTMDKLSEKLNIYRKASNTRFVVYGTSAFLICIGFYMTNFQAFAVLFGIMIVLFSINNPNARKIVNDLKLRDQEKEIILNGLDIP